MSCGLSVDACVGYTYADYKHGQLVPVRTVETEKRYTIQDSTADIMDAKMSMLSVFSYVKSIRGQFRLKRFLSYFAELRREMDEVKVGASQIANITEILTDDRLNIETVGLKIQQWYHVLLSYPSVVWSSLH